MLFNNIIGSVQSGVVQLGSNVNPFDTVETFNNGKLVITFDDGNDSIYSNISIFETQGVKTTQYINSAVIGSAGKMSWANLQAMHNAGHDIQCHTHNHIDILTLSDADLRASFEAVNAAFTANNIPVPKHHAYPYGSANWNAKNITAEYRLTGRNAGKNPVVAYENNTTDKLTGKYSIPSCPIDNISGKNLEILKRMMLQCQTEKKAITLYSHGISATGGTLAISASALNEIIDYAQTIGMDIITISELYKAMRLKDRCTDIEAEIVSETEINLYWKNANEAYDTIIERSTDNVSWTELATVDKALSTYNDTTLVAGTSYFYRLKKTNSPHYSKTFSLVNIAVEATGDASGVGQLNLYFGNNNLTLNAFGGVKFYTNSDGTLNESAFWDFTKANPQNSVYIKCTGNGNIKLSGERVGRIETWTAGTNAPKITFNLGYWKNITSVFVNGNSEIQGSINNLTKVRYFYLNVLNVMTGDVAGLTKLQYFSNPQSNTLSITSVANIPSLTFFHSGKSPLSTTIVNQLLADFVANINKVKYDDFSTERKIFIHDGTVYAPPTGQGLIDKQYLLDNGFTTVLTDT